MIGNAAFSSCERYRYMLSRQWAPGHRCMFLMLNPSTADAEVNDPTIRRCIGFSKSWGYSGLWVGNAYAWRATDPDELWKQWDPVGPANMDALRWMASDSELVVCAWGGNVRPDQAEHIFDMLRSVERSPHAMKLTSKRQPCHPLYLKGSLAPKPIMELRQGGAG